MTNAICLDKVSAFHQAYGRIESAQTALTVIPAPIVRYVRPKTVVESISDVCYKVAIASAAALVFALIALAVGLALSFEAGKAARRYWVEHNLTHRIITAALCAGLAISIEYRTRAPQVQAFAQMFGANVRSWALMFGDGCDRTFQVAFGLN